MDFLQLLTEREKNKYENMEVHQLDLTKNLSEDYVEPVARKRIDEFNLNKTLVTTVDLFESIYARPVTEGRLYKNFLELVEEICLEKPKRYTYTYYPMYVDNAKECAIKVDCYFLAPREIAKVIITHNKLYGENGTLILEESK